MGEKISTIILKVDLECHRCYKKIRRVLCKIQDKMNIKMTSFDEKSNTVTISGPFDAEKVCKKLCCQAGRIIKEMNIKGKESKDTGKPEKVKDGKADKDTKAEKDKPPEKKEANKEGKPEKKEGQQGDDAKPGRAVPKADIEPLLEKLRAVYKAMARPEPPRGEPIAPPAAAPVAAQGVAVPSIWPAPASSVAWYSYNPSYYGGGFGGGYGYGCGCGYAAAYCQCGKPAAAPGGYYGVPVCDNQGWYYGGRQAY